MSRRRPIPSSEAQQNADALARRGSPYSAASAASFTWAYDYHRREPSDLRDAVRMARRAYSDEVPTKLHDGPDAIGDDGAPRWSARAEGYIFGSPSKGDEPPDEEPLVAHYLTPFRAALDRMTHGNLKDQQIAGIVSHVTIGGGSPVEAAVKQGIPYPWAGDCAELALRAFLRSMTDLKLSLPRDSAA